MKATIRNCCTCGERIPVERLKCLPDTLTCVGCSRVRPRTADDMDLDGGEQAGMLGAFQAPDKDTTSMGRG